MISKPRLKKYYKNKKILVTGGAGSIGSDIIRNLLSYNPSEVRIFDNNEAGLSDLEHELKSKKVRFIYGDVRDKNRLRMSFSTIDLVFHSAALKHVGLCEQNPSEAIKTNVLGTQNLIDCALEEGVEKVIGISSDKAVDPINVMGGTKLLAERLFLSAERNKVRKKTLFSCVRFGNVLASRGSVIPLFINQISKGGPVTITNESMVRYAMKISDSVKLILKACYLSRGREIFILKMPVIRITDLAEVLIKELAPKYGFSPSEIKVKIIGHMSYEKLTEELVADNELPYLRNSKEMFVLDFKKTNKLRKLFDRNKLTKSKIILKKRELTKLLKQNKIRPLSRVI